MIVLNAIYICFYKGSRVVRDIPEAVTTPQKGEENV